MKNSNNKQPTLELLSIKYVEEQRSIDCLVFVSRYLILFSGSLLVWSLFSKNEQSTLSLLASLGVMISALIVAHVASRALTFQQIDIKQKNNKTKAANLHFAIAVIDELMGRIQFLSALFVRNNEGTAITPSDIALNIQRVEKRYEQLLTHELFLTLPGTFFQDIQKIAGSVFGLIRLSEQVTLTAKNSPSNTVHFSEAVSNQKIELLHQFNEELSELRESLFDQREALEAE